MGCLCVCVYVYVCMISSIFISVFLLIPFVVGRIIAPPQYVNNQTVRTGENVIFHSERDP